MDDSTRRNLHRLVHKVFGLRQDIQVAADAARLIGDSDEAAELYGACEKLRRIQQGFNERADTVTRTV